MRASFLCLLFSLLVLSMACIGDPTTLTGNLDEGDLEADGDTSGDGDGSDADDDSSDADGDSDNDGECEPKSCDDLFSQCGEALDDGCGQTITCSCPDHHECNSDNICECIPESDSELCRDSNSCALLNFTNRCGETREIVCLPCPVGEDCENGRCECKPIDREEFCSENNFSCGEHQASGDCGEQEIHCGSCREDEVDEAEPMPACQGNNRCDMVLVTTTTYSCQDNGICIPVSEEALEYRNCTTCPATQPTCANGQCTLTCQDVSDCPECTNGTPACDAFTCICLPSGNW